MPVVWLVEAVWVAVPDPVVVVPVGVVVSVPEVGVLSPLPLPVEESSLPLPEEESPLLADPVLVETGTVIVEPSDVVVVKSVVACYVY